MSGWQVSGDAPSFYQRYAYAIQAPWTDDLILQAGCKNGDRVLDVACGPGLVAGRVNEVSKVTCKITGIDVDEAMLNAARKNPDIEWHLAVLPNCRSMTTASTSFSANKACNTFPTAGRA